ncbi:hypothetical protein IFR05_003686 [Cadophora sp. M221]|nr:hypothetical protein IFR05_003686 [Cadophora sp. M221]
MSRPNVSNPPLPPVDAGRANANSLHATPAALSNPGDSWVWDFRNPAVNNQAAKKTNKRAATDAWMPSRNRVGKGWVAKRFLGRGTYGVVGHWSYEGPDRDSKSLKDVAVKQSVRFAFPLGGFGLQFEAANLSELGRAKSQHIVKMYRHLYEELGQHTNQFDVGLVHHIFLEYCPGGDVGNWIRNHLYSNTTLSDAELWAIFQSLARACLFGDLGNGRRFPEVQSPQSLRDYSEFGTPGYFAPVIYKTLLDVYLVISNQATGTSNTKRSLVRSKTLVRSKLTPAATPPVLHNVTQVTCIVQTKSFFGNFLFKNYTINNLTPDTLVIDTKRTLAAMSCGITQDKQVWMNGRTLMSDYMKLGEFANLVGGRNTVRVTSR